MKGDEHSTIHSFNGYDTLLFNARCYASAVLAIGLCLSVSVCHKSEFY